MFQPSYIKTVASAEFARRIARSTAALKSCRLCPRQCDIDRTKTDKTPCHTGADAIISSAFPHFGEEKQLSGQNGSGTIFISGCNLQCVFCQNFEISHLLSGESVSPESFAERMLALQNQGCHNINIVTPSHIIPSLLQAIKLAAEAGLNLPLVYNTSGYDAVSSLKLLDGIVDIYLPDFKFFNDDIGKKYFAVDNYGSIIQQSMKEMHRQTGDLQLIKGIAKRGLLVRHLVMPGMLAESRKIFQFIAREISPDTFVNIMPQYNPAGRSSAFPEINRSLYRDEYEQAVSLARQAGLKRIQNVAF